MIFSPLGLQCDRSADNSTPEPAEAQSAGEKWKHTV
jgi:hypothetical protein